MFVNMKVIITVAIVLFAVGAYGASLYDLNEEKTKAKEEVKILYDNVIQYAEKVAKEVDNELGKKEEDSKTEAVKEVNDRHTATGNTFDKNVIDTTRAAIARGKPVLAVECIAKTSKEGKKIIEETRIELSAAVEAVLPNRIRELELEKIQVELIKKATEGLNVESIAKINNEKDVNNIKTHKGDAARKAGTALKQLQEIEKRVLKDVLKDRYRTLRVSRVPEKFKEVQETLYKRLQKCIA